MKKVLALLVIALFSATAVFAGDVVNAAPTAAPVKKVSKKLGKHHTKKQKAPVAAVTPAK
jgi:hypothetical protein